MPDDPKKPAPLTDSAQVLLALDGCEPEVVDFAKLEQRVAAALAHRGPKILDHLSLLVEPPLLPYNRADLDVVDRMLREHAQAFPVVADWCDRTRAMKSTYDALYLPYQREVLKQRRFMETYGAGGGKIRDAIGPAPVRRRPQIVMGCGAALGPGKTSDFLSGFTVDVPRYSLTVSERMIDAAERVLAQHVTAAYARRAALVDTFVRGLDRVRTGRRPSAPEFQFLGAGAPRNPRKPGG